MSTAVGLKMIYLLQKKDIRSKRGWVPVRAYTMEETANKQRKVEETDCDLAGDHNILWSVTPIELEG